MAIRQKDGVSLREKDLQGSITFCNKYQIFGGIRRLARYEANAKSPDTRGNKIPLAGSGPLAAKLQKNRRFFPQRRKES